MSKSFIQQFIRQFVVQLAPIALGTTVIFIVLNLFGDRIASSFEPVYWRFLYWQSGLAFGALLAGVAILLLISIFRFYSPSHSEKPAPVGRLAAKQLTDKQLTAEQLTAKQLTAGQRPRLTMRLTLGFALGLLIFSALEVEWALPRSVPWDVTMQPQESLLQAQERALALAARQKRPLLYYFHADWCAACEPFERYLLGSPHISSTLQGYILVRLDVSHELWYSYMQQHFALSAVPALRLGSPDGQLLGPSLQGAHISHRLVRALLERLQTENSQQFGRIKETRPKGAGWKTGKRNQ